MGQKTVGGWRSPLIQAKGRKGWEMWDVGWEVGGGLQGMSEKEKCFGMTEQSSLQV